MTGLRFHDLLEYTEWQRQTWRGWLKAHPEALAASAGPRGDGRFRSVGDLIKHIFSAEKRYIDRMAGREITDTSALPVNDAVALFEFGRESRSALREFIDGFPAEEWDTFIEMPLMDSILRASARKIVGHILLHEVRHWAQIATILRLAGEPADLQDLILSPAMGGEIRKATPAR